MRPDQYELFVAQYYKAQGYKTTITPGTNDYGVDVFAEKGKTKLAIQAKLYGSTSRKVNRQMIMELYGACAYFDCTDAVLITNGAILETAKEVAGKLKVKILHLDPDKNIKTPKTKAETFEDIWEKHIMPLEGKVIQRSNGDKNTILKVDWAGVERMTSSGKKQRIKIEIFRKTVNHLFKYGSITRKVINEEYIGRASSGVILILSSADIFQFMSNPSRLIYKNNKVKIL